MVTTRFKLIALAILALVASAAAAAAQNVNSSTPLIVPQQSEAAVSPAAPGLLPGTLTNETTGINPLTGLPCTGGGSLAISGAGGLSDSANQPPDSTSPTPQLPSLNSVFGSGTSLGAC
jgi:hypothetical protein